MKPGPSILLQKLGVQICEIGVSLPAFGEKSECQISRKF